MIFDANLQSKSITSHELDIGFDESVFQKAILKQYHSKDLQIR